MARRPHPLVLTVLSLIGGLLAGAFALLLTGNNPLLAYGVLLGGALATARDLSFVLIRSTPLILTGLSVAFAFRSGLFNIGAEGQYIVGALAAAAAGVFWPLPSWLHIPVVMLVGMAAGAGWGAFAGALKAARGIHEVISTIMLNWIALYLNNFLVMLPGFNRPESEASQKILDTARMDWLGTWKTSAEGLAFRQQHPLLDDILRTPANAGILVAVAMVFVVAFLLNRTVLGFQLRAVGSNPEAAAFAGIPVRHSQVLSMAIAGALAGLAGALQVQGVTREVARLAAMEGNGFDGIAVALIGFSEPLGVLGAGLFYGALKHAGPKLQPAMGIPMEIIQIIMGSVILFLALPGIWVALWKTRIAESGRKIVGRLIHRRQ